MAIILTFLGMLMFKRTKYNADGFYVSGESLTTWISANVDSDESVMVNARKRTSIV